MTLNKVVAVARQPHDQLHVHWSHPSLSPAACEAGLCLHPPVWGRSRCPPPLLAPRSFCPQFELLLHLAQTCSARVNMTNTLLSSTCEGFTATQLPMWPPRLLGSPQLLSSSTALCPSPLLCPAENSLRSSHAQRGETRERRLNTSSCPLPKCRVFPGGREEGN